MSAPDAKVCYSKLSAGGRIALPRAVRERLKVLPGDRLRYLVDDRGVRIERAAGASADGSFATFSEWSSEADDEAFVGL